MMSDLAPGSKVQAVRDVVRTFWEKVQDAQHEPSIAFPPWKHPVIRDPPVQRLRALSSPSLQSLLRARGQRNTIPRLSSQTLVQTMSTLPSTVWVGLPRPSEGPAMEMVAKKLWQEESNFRSRHERMEIHRRDCRYRLTSQIARRRRLERASGIVRDM